MTDDFIRWDEPVELFMGSSLEDMQPIGELQDAVVTMNNGLSGLSTELANLGSISFETTVQLADTRGNFRWLREVIRDAHADRVNRARHARKRAAVHFLNLGGETV